MPLRIPRNTPAKNSTPSNHSTIRSSEDSLSTSTTIATTKLYPTVTTRWYFSSTVANGPIKPFFPPGLDYPFSAVSLKSFWNFYFLTDQILIRFTAAHDAEAVSFDEHLGGAAPGVVIGRFDKSVGPGRPDDQQVPSLGHFQRVIQCQKIARLADRPHDIDGNLLRGRCIAAGAANGGRDGVLSFIQDRTYQIVHGSIRDHESLSGIALHVNHAREQHASGPHKPAAGFNQQLTIKSPGEPGERARINRQIERLFLLVANAHAAADIDDFKTNAACRQFAHMRGQLAERPATGSRAQNLRAEVSADAAPDNPSRIILLEIKAARRIPVHSKFMVVLAGGNVLVAAGGNIGVDANSQRWPLAARVYVALRFFEQELQFRFRFHVEKKNPALGGVGVGCRVA